MTCKLPEHIIISENLLVQNVNMKKRQRDEHKNKAYKWFVHILLKPEAMTSLKRKHIYMYVYIHVYN